MDVAASYFFVTSFATAGSVPYGDFGASGVPSPGYTYSPLVLSDSFNEANTNFTAPGAYTLREVYNWTSSPAGLSFNRHYRE